MTRAFCDADNSYITNKMITILTIIHITVCLFLVSIVLLQHGKGADIGATFGGSSQSLFGTEGPVPLMNKVTTGISGLDGML